jgi:predicted cupin superfamily sugar epimerase
MSAEEWIATLQLLPHPEGGYFRETYRCSESIARQHLPPRFGGDRAFSTAIYYMLRGQEFSALHRIHQDEVWHFYDGGTLHIHIIDVRGEHSVVRLGRNPGAGEVLQAVTPAGSLFGARLADPQSFALVGCTVAPGFDFADFAMPARAELLAAYPRHAAIIEQLTRA